MKAPSERDVQALARQIAEAGGGEKSRLFRGSWWSEQLLDWAMAKDAFKTQLFRFVDVFPALDGDDDVARHLSEYFDGIAIPKLLDLGVEIADRVKVGRSIEARVARQVLAFAEYYGQPQPNGDIQIPLRLTQSDLAAMLGASREHINKVIVSYKERGYLSINRQYHLTIHNQSALARRA